MGLYNFKQQFAPFILEGSKTHTIRATRKIPEKVGNTMHLYTGLRQKGATLLFRAPCVKVEEINIHPAGFISIDGSELRPDEANLLAWADGFRPIESTKFAPVNSMELSGCFELMMTFWEGRMPFNGHIIYWNFSARQLQ